MDITSLFNQYAGKEIQVNEEHVTREIAGETIGYDVVSPAANEPTLAAMKKTAADNGVRLRVFFPGSVGTCDYRKDRVNVHVDKEADGKWRVQPGFHVG